jgi:hypothetical protein
MNVRTFPLVGGAIALALGGLLAVTGTALLPPGPVRVLAYAVAVLGVLAMATLDVLTRTTVDVSPATLSGADRREGLATPGDDVDETLASLSGEDRRGRRAVRERVEAVGAGVLARHRNCSRETARELLEAGDWTDDRRAAALFTDPTPSLGERVRSLVVGRSTFRRRVAAATAELERIAAEETTPEDDGEQSPGDEGETEDDEEPTPGDGEGTTPGEPPTAADGATVEEGSTAAAADDPAGAAPDGGPAAGGGTDG